MAKMKYDWNKLKLDFFTSDFDEVKGFIKSLGGSYDGNCRKQTKGRASEKQEYKQKILERALKENSDKEVKNLEIPLSFLMKAKKNALVKIAMGINNSEDIGKIVKGLNSIKTELGEPTSISKTDATIKTTPLDESLFIQD